MIFVQQRDIEGLYRLEAVVLNHLEIPRHNTETSAYPLHTSTQLGLLCASCAIDITRV